MKYVIDDACRDYLIELLTDRYYKITDIKELAVINRIYTDLQCESESWLNTIYEKRRESK